jgi:hypothetical protein
MAEAVDPLGLRFGVIAVVAVDAGRDGPDLVCEAGATRC